jgi:hypothetical protein
MIQRYLWTGASALSGVGAFVALTSYIALPVGLTALAVAALYKAYTTRNYDSSREVAAYRKECSNGSLEKALKNHGHFVFSRKLLSTEELNKKYIEAENNLHTIPSLITFHSSIEAFRKQGDDTNLYTIPNPRRLQKHFQELSAYLSILDIESKHSLEYLFSWELLSPKSFKEKYREHQYYLFSISGIGAVIAHYKKTQKALEFQPAEVSYEIPEPKDLSEHWYNSLKTMDLDTLQSDSTINDLITYKIISNPKHIQNIKKILEDLKDLDKNHSSTVTLINDQYTKKINKADVQLAREKQTISLAKEVIYAKRREMRNYIKLLKIEIENAKYTGNRSILTRLENTLSTAQFALSADTFVDVLFTEQKLNANLEDAIRQHTQAKIEAEQDKKKSLKAVGKEYTNDRTAIESLWLDFKESITE